jgi:hypothetical protein
MRASLPASIVLASLMAACHSSDAHRYRITSATRDDRGRVKTILREIASEAGFRPRRPTPYDSPVIVLYGAPEVDLRASLADSDIRVSLTRFEWPPPKAFSRADQMLLVRLPREFGGRFAVEPPPQVQRTIRVH